jgi:hypothetical protein
MTAGAGGTWGGTTNGTNAIPLDYSPMQYVEIRGYDGRMWRYPVMLQPPVITGYWSEPPLLPPGVKQESHKVRPQ